MTNHRPDFKKSLLKQFYKNRLMMFVLGFAIISSIALIVTHAANPTVSLEAENGTITGPATSCGTDSTASNSGCVQFKAASSSKPAGIYVSGNKLVDSQGNTIQLRGVDRSGGEYACAQGWGFWDGPADQTSINAMKTWHINAVRLPVNEACWLGIDGVNSTYGGQNYINQVVSFVNLLNSNNIYVIIDYQWGACGSTSTSLVNCAATSQKDSPDRPNATTFWSSVANQFKDNHAVLFDLFNEPFNDAGGWSCWKNGGCNSTSASYVSEGMQPMVTAIRNAGAATQPILLGGMHYSNQIDGWLANLPTDPNNSEVLSLHIYGGGSGSYPCNTTACFDSGGTQGAYLGSIAASHPVVIGEFGESTSPPAAGTFDTQLMQWGDSHNYSYLAWTWDAYGVGSCGGAIIISDYSGTPCANYGTSIKNHYVTFPAAGPIQ